MQVGFADLLAWSFLIASAHGTGLMLVPALVPLRLVRSRAGDITAVDALINSLAAVGVHAAALVSNSGIIALLVYDWIGVGFLRRGWIAFGLAVDTSAWHYRNDRARALSLT